MVSFVRVTNFFGLIIILTFLFDGLLANQKIKRLPAGFRYTEDLEVAASEHGGR